MVVRLGTKRERTAVAGRPAAADGAATLSGVDKIAGFLARFPPFDKLSDAEQAGVAASAEVRAYPAGDDALIEDGPPASHFFIVRTGSMELLHDDEMIDLLEPGEGFGHPSLLTGLAPTFTVRAHEDSTCYLIPGSVALEVLGRPAGARFVAMTLRERLTRTGHTVHALPEVRTLRIADLVTRPALFCTAETSIKEAAARMTEAHASAVLVQTRDELGIVTDADLRENVVAGRVPPDGPVASVMTTPVITAPHDRLAIEVVIDMLDAGIHHMPVVGPSGEVLGVVSADELAHMESQGPFALRRSIAHAPDENALADTASHLPRLFTSLLASGLSPADIGRVLALQSDTVTARLIDFAVRRHGSAPVPWAWLALGSGARRELTLGSDQDNALAYADSDAPEAVDAYFAQLAAAVNAGLVRCGFGRDAADVAASSPRWRMSESAWLRVLRESLETPDRSHMVRAAVSFDFRHVAGSLEIVPPLVEVLRSAKDHPDFIRRLARTATDFRPPLGFRRTIVVERDEGNGGRLDIKRGGVLPIVNLARFHALSHGITISPTLDRLVAAEQIGALDRETAESLREAFEIVWRLRLEQHAAQIGAGFEPDNFIDPAHLPPLTRIELREAFRAVARAQKQLGRYVPLGM